MRAIGGINPDNIVNISVDRHFHCGYGHIGGRKPKSTSLILSCMCVCVHDICMGLVRDGSSETI